MSAASSVDDPAWGIQARLQSEVRERRERIARLKILLAEEEQLTRTATRTPLQTFLSIPPEHLDEMSLAREAFLAASSRNDAGMSSGFAAPAPSSGFLSNESNANSVAAASASAPVLFHIVVVGDADVATFLVSPSTTVASFSKVCLSRFQQARFLCVNVATEMNKIELDHAPPDELVLEYLSRLGSDRESGYGRNGRPLELGEAFRLPPMFALSRAPPPLRRRLLDQSSQDEANERAATDEVFLQIQLLRKLPKKVTHRPGKRRSLRRMYRCSAYEVFLTLVLRDPANTWIIDDASFFARSNKPSDLHTIHTSRELMDEAWLGSLSRARLSCATLSRSLSETMRREVDARPAWLCVFKEVVTGATSHPSHTVSFGEFTNHWRRLQRVVLLTEEDGESVTIGSVASHRVAAWREEMEAASPRVYVDLPSFIWFRRLAFVCSVVGFVFLLTSSVEIFDSWSQANLADSLVRPVASPQDVSEVYEIFNSLEAYGQRTRLYDVENHLLLQDDHDHDHEEGEHNETDAIDPHLMNVRQLRVAMDPSNGVYPGYRRSRASTERIEPSTSWSEFSWEHDDAWQVRGLNGVYDVSGSTTSMDFSSEDAGVDAATRALITQFRVASSVGDLSSVALDVTCLVELGSAGGWSARILTSPVNRVTPLKVPGIYVVIAASFVAALAAAASCAVGHRRRSRGCCGRRVGARPVAEDVDPENPVAEKKESSSEEEETVVLDPSFRVMWDEFGDGQTFVPFFADTMGGRLDLAVLCVGLAAGLFAVGVVYQPNRVMPGALICSGFTVVGTLLALDRSTMRLSDAFAGSPLPVLTLGLYYAVFVVGFGLATFAWFGVGSDSFGDGGLARATPFGTVASSMTSLLSASVWGGVFLGPYHRAQASFWEMLLFYVFSFFTVLLNFALVAVVVDKYQRLARRAEEERRARNLDGFEIGWVNLKRRLTKPREYTFGW